MNPIDDNSPDPEDTLTATAQAEPELGRKFYWRGKELAAFSYNCRSALFRLFPGVGVSNYEYDYMLVFLLLQPPKTVGALRTEEQLSAFRQKVDVWVDSNKLEGAYDEIHALAQSILQPVEDAESLEPALPPGEHAAPGNA